MRRARRKPAPAGLMVNGRRLNAPQAAMLRAAARAEVAGDAVGGRRLCLRLEAELEAADEAHWLAGALEEMKRLEAGRGQTVEATRDRVRIRDRDGLEALRATGALDAGAVAAGLRYRHRFEDAQPRVSSALAIRPGGTGGRPDRPEAVALRMSQARRELDGMEQAVADRYRAEGRPALAADALLALREVAGLGRSIRELASSGHRRAALKTRLAEALEVAARREMQRPTGASRPAR